MNQTQNLRNYTETIYLVLLPFVTIDELPSESVNSKTQRKLENSLRS